MKIFLLMVLNLFVSVVLSAQKTDIENKQALIDLIDQYSLAREKQDTILLKNILTSDVDQLVSTGEWRNGIGSAIQGMLRSYASNAGSRKLLVDKVRVINSQSAIVDARYEIQNPNGTIRKMWSTFITVYVEGRWKISAIRNMLPAQP